MIKSILELKNDLRHQFPKSHSLLHTPKPCTKSDPKHQPLCFPSPDTHFLVLTIVFPPWKYFKDNFDNDGTPKAAKRETIL